MSVVLVENHSVPMIAANVIVKTGSREETWETWGAAHFLEHLLFNGTENRTQEEIYAEFDRIGAYHNAHTGTHFTGFMLLAARDNFTTGFEILTDMLWGSTLPQDKFEKECGIVIEEIARSASMASNSERLLDEVLFEGSPLLRSVLGTEEGIARLGRDSLLAFYHRWYVPNNMFLFATGDFAADTLFEWLQAQLARYPPRELPPRRHIDPPDFPRLSGRGTIRRWSAGEMRELTFALAAPRPGEADFVPMLMLNAWLDRRLGDLLPPAVSGSTQLMVDPDLAVFNITLTTPLDGPGEEELISSLDRILNGLAANPPSEDQIAALALRYRMNRILNSERLHHYGIVNAEYWALVSWDEFDSWPARQARLTPDELADAARRWLVDRDRLVMLIEPPPSEDKATTFDTDGGIQRFVSDGGPTILVRSDPSARVFALHILAPHRWLWDGQFGAGAVDLLHQLIGQSASIPESKAAAKMEELAATLKATDDPSIPYDNYYTTPEFSFIRLEMLPDRWQEGVAMVAELMLNLPRSEDVLQSAREMSSRCRAALGRAPIAAGRQRIRERLFYSCALGSEVYGDVSRISLADLEELQKGCFNPRNLIVSVSGSMDADEVAEVIEREFRRLARFDYPPPSIEPESKTTPSRDTLSLGLPQGAIITGDAIYQIDRDDAPALIVANAWLNEQMGLVLRERQGLAYSLGSTLTLRGTGGKRWAYWEQYLATRSENLHLAEEGIRKLLAQLSEHRFTPEEVERLVNAISGRIAMRNMPHIGQAYSMGVGELLWGTPDIQDQLTRELANVHPEQVQAAAHRYLSPQGLKTVVVR